MAKLFFSSKAFWIFILLLMAHDMLRLFCIKYFHFNILTFLFQTIEILFSKKFFLSMEVFLSLFYDTVLYITLPWSSCHVLVTVRGEG